MADKPKMLGIIPLGGGMNIGLERAGFEHLDTSLELAEGWTRNLQLNRPEITTHITNLEDWEAFLETQNENPPELVFGSPPCQGVTGASKTSGADNPKNQWMLHFTRAVTTLQPRFAIAENIPRMLTIGRPIVNEMEEIARKGGYSMAVHMHHVEQFGVCQRRKRVMFVFEPKGKEIYWPSHPILQAPTVDETIGDLTEMPTVEDVGTPVFYTGEAENEWQAALRNPEGYTWDHDRKILPDRFASVLPGTAWWDTMDPELMTEKEKERIAENKLYNAMEMMKLHPDKVARTMTGARNKIHPHLNRLLSVRECSRLMAFPDDWKWAVPGDVQQFAAGVCPPVTEWYGHTIIRELSGKPMPVLEGRLF